jgi:hypothetical protein
MFQPTCRVTARWRLTLKVPLLVAVKGMLMIPTVFTEAPLKVTAEPPHDREVDPMDNPNDPVVRLKYGAWDLVPWAQPFEEFPTPKEVTCTQDPPNGATVGPP